MADKVSIVIDAGHGGQDPGAVFQGREEKTDTLRLALAVGQILTENGMDVSYTRVTDRYHTPGEKAEMANYQDSGLFSVYSQKCHAGSGDSIRNSDSDL